VRLSGRVFRISPLICVPMNADFDGDQAAVFLPVTEAAQREAGEKLSVAGQVKRDPALVELFRPTMEAIWGLAELSRTPDGHKEVETLAGTEVAAPEGYVTRETLVASMVAVMEREGIEAALACSERLARCGFELSRRSGASMSPFIGESLRLPPEPDGDDPQAWLAHAEACRERIAARSDFDDSDLGPQLLALKTGARGSVHQLAWMLCSRGVVIDTENQPRIIIRRPLTVGMAPDEVYACTIGARKGLARVAIDCVRAGYGVREPRLPQGFNVLSRAMRSERPGIVFAGAAGSGETDPLRDVDSRLFVGLKPL